MKSIELRIGNYVNDEETIHVVVGIDQWLVYSYWQKDKEKETLYKTPINQIKPIPLTEEWLLRLGFDKSGSTVYINIGRIEIGTIASGKRFYIQIGIENVTLEIHSVHQLQNLYFALTGQELAIVNPIT